MTERMYRAQILLDPNQHRRLREMAKRENRSISELTRELLEDGLRRRELATRSRLERIEAAGAAAERILRDRGGEPFTADPETLLDEAKKERGDALGGH